jgi:hypothetical protein
VQNFNGTANISITSNGGTLVDSNGAPLSQVTFTNGVGTFMVKAPASVPSTPSDTISTSNLVSTNGSSIATNVSYATATINYVASTPVSLSLKPSTATFSDNDGTKGDQLTLYVNDASGNPVTGTVSQYVTLTLTGPGSFAPVGVGQQPTTTTTVYVTSGTSTPVSVYPLQGQSGNVVVTATATGLQSGSTTINMTSTGLPANITFSGTNGTVTSQNGAGLTPGTTFTLYTVQLVDSNGNPVAPTSSDVFTISDNSQNVPAGQTPGTLKYYSVNTYNQPTGSAWTGSNSTYTQAVPANGELQFAVLNTSVGPSPVTITVTDSLTGKSQTATYNYSAGAPAKVTLPNGTMSQSYNLAAGSNVTVTVQLQDANNNNAAVAGKNVSFYFAGNTANATINGSSAWNINNPVVVSTNSNGQASVTVAVPSSAAASQSFTVDASYNGQATPVTVTGTVQSPANLGSAFVLSTTQPPTGGTPTAATWPSSASVPAGAYITGISGGALTTSTVAQQPSLYANLTNAVGQDVTGGTTADTIQVTTSNPNVLAVKISGSWTQSNAGPTTTSVTNSETNNGVQLPELQGLQAGTATITIQDLSNPNVPTVSYNVTVTASTASGNAQVFYNGSKVSSTNKLAVAANTPVAVQIVNVDAAGNPVPVVNSGQVVALSDSANGGAFTATSGGAPISYVTIPVGQTQTTVYYVNANGGSYDLSGDTTDIGQGLSVNTTPTAAPAGSTFTYVITLSGNGASSFNGTLPISVTGALNSPNGTAAVVPSTVSFNSGSANVAVKLYDAAAQTLTFTVDGLSATAGSVTPTAAVAAATPTSTISATTASATSPYTSTVTVVLKDQYGNAVTGKAANFTVTNSTATGTVIIGSVTESGSTPGTYTFTVSDTAHETITFTVEEPSGTTIGTVAVTF